MSFSTTYTRFKIFVSGGTVLPADLNGIQDDLGNQLATINVAGGFTEGGNVRRGKFVQTAAGTRSNTGYGALSNGPDYVANVVLNTDGIICVLYRALWQETNADAARAAIFLNGVQVRNILRTSEGSGPGGQAAATGASVGTQLNLDQPLISSQGGLVSWQAPTSTAYTGDVTTGQIVGMVTENLEAYMNIGGSDVACSKDPGGEVMIEAAAGTYTVEIKFLASSGTVTVKNRRLRVWTQSFG